MQRVSESLLALQHTAFWHFREFLAHQQTRQQEWGDELKTLNTDDTDALGLISGKKIRQWIIDTPFPCSLRKSD
jgi:pyruvate,water dikinase